MLLLINEWTELVIHFLFGIHRGNIIELILQDGVFFFLLSLVISLAIFIYGKFLFTDAVNKKTIFLVSFFIFAFALGLLRYEIKDLPARDLILDKNLGQKVIIEGVVSDEPDKRENGVKLTLSFRNFMEDGKIFPVNGKGIMTTDFYPEYLYGDLLKIEGKIQKPKNFQNEKSRNF